jgi:hypothetical protein
VNTNPARFAAVGLAFLASAGIGSAETSAISGLGLLPAPKEIHLGEGAFVVTPASRIVLDARHATEDRTAAEMLQAEVRERGGITLPIGPAAAAAKGGGVLSLERLVDKDLDDQGYVIRATPSGIVVSGKTTQGLFYGVQTLRQLLRPEGKRLRCPAVTIRDWPTMPWRGVHDDVSRGPIPTLDYMKKEIRTLSEYKINLFALYMEHVFDSRSQPLVAPGEAAITADEIKELVSYAKKYHVTILPEQQAFGHLHHVLKYEAYSDLAETPHGHVLTPTNPGTYDFIRQVYSEIAPLFPGPFFHIGSDETFELGRGRTKALAEEKGLGRVYLEHLQKVAEIMRPYHKELLFWGDIAVKYPELLTLLPKDMIAVPWDYDARASFDDILTPYEKAGIRMVVAPGANNWERIWPDLNVALVNIRNFVRDGQKHGAIGMLNTTWDDDGETLFDMTWPSMVFGAAASWQPGESSIDDFRNSYDWAFYRNGDRAFSDVIDGLDRPNALLAGVGLESASNDLFWSDPFSAVGAGAAAKAEPALRDLRLAAEGALRGLIRDGAKARLHQDTLDDMAFAAWRLDALGMKLQFTLELNRFYWDAYLNKDDPERVHVDLREMTSINARLEDLRDVATRLRKMHEDAWLRENRPYWLGNVLVRYDNLASEMQAKIVAVRQARAEYEEKKSLPPPEQMGMWLKP